MRNLDRLTDGELLAGEGQAMAAFYRRFEDGILAFFRWRTGSSELAVDLAAETFVRAVEGRDRFDPERGEAAAWLYGIAAHVLAESLRRGRVEDRARRRLALEPLAVDDAALARVDELGDELAVEALTGLPAALRDAVTGRVLDGQSYEGLAKALRCSESLVRQRVSRGLRQLRATLSEET